MYTRPDVGNKVKDDSSKKISLPLFSGPGFLIAALSWNPSFFSSLLTVFEVTGFSRWSLSSTVIFRGIFVTIPKYSCKSLTAPISFHFLPEFSFSEMVLPFSNAVVIFETVFLATSNNSVVFVIHIHLLYKHQQFDLFKV